MKPNNNLNHFQQLLFHTIPPPLDQYNHFGLTKNGRQNRSSGAKTGLLRFRFKMLVSNDSMYFYNSFLSFQIKDFYTTVFTRFSSSLFFFFLPQSLKINIFAIYEAIVVIFSELPVVLSTRFVKKKFNPSTRGTSRISSR